MAPPAPRLPGTARRGTHLGAPVAMLTTLVLPGVNIRASTTFLTSPSVSERSRRHSASSVKLRMGTRGGEVGSGGISTRLPLRGSATSTREGEVHFAQGTPGTQQDWPQFCVGRGGGAVWNPKVQKFVYQK